MCLEVRNIIHQFPAKTFLHFEWMHNSFRGTFKVQPEKKLYRNQTQIKVKLFVSTLNCTLSKGAIRVICYSCLFTAATFPNARNRLILRRYEILFKTIHSDDNDIICSVPSVLSRGSVWAERTGARPAASDRLRLEPVRPEQGEDEERTGHTDTEGLRKTCQQSIGSDRKRTCSTVRFKRLCPHWKPLKKTN